MSICDDNMSEEEMVILDRCAMAGDDIEDYFDELRQAAFDHYWDGETDEEEFKEEAWQDGYPSYQNYIAEWNSRPLFASLERGHEDYFINAIEDGASANVLDDHGIGPLHAAVSYGRAKAVDFLIKRGINVDVQDANQETPLMVAARLGRAEVAKLLLERGADVNARDKDGSTALMLGARAGYAGTVSFLLENGADLTARDHNGRTARVLADAHGHQAMAALLQSAELSASLAPRDSCALDLRPARSKRYRL